MLALPPQEAKTIFEQFDKDGNGTLSFDEFLVALRVNCVFLCVIILGYSMGLAMRQSSVVPRYRFTCGSGHESV